ncbi:MAG: sigma-70 family RNA polymerase sigma factor [Psychroflexus maritimus]
MKEKKSHPDVCNEIVYKKLFHNIGEQLFQFLFLKYQNTEIAREGMQEAFITLWKNCKNVPEAKAKNYVFTVGRNRVVDILRKKNKHLSITNEDYISEDKTEEVSDQKKQKMNYILSIMPEASKEAFLMNRVQGLKYKEIAEELEISVKAVEKRISIALETIRKEIEK